MLEEKEHAVDPLREGEKEECVHHKYRYVLEEESEPHGLIRKASKDIHASAEGRLPCRDIEQHTQAALQPNKFGARAKKCAIGGQERHVPVDLAEAPSIVEKGDVWEEHDGQPTEETVPKSSRRPANAQLLEELRLENDQVRRSAAREESRPEVEGVPLEGVGRSPLPKVVRTLRDASP